MAASWGKWVEGIVARKHLLNPQVLKSERLIGAIMEVRAGLYPRASHNLEYSDARNREGSRRRTDKGEEIADPYLDLFKEGAPGNTRQPSSPLGALDPIWG